MSLSDSNGVALWTLAAIGPSTAGLPVPMRILGLAGEFAPTGSTGFLLDYFGLNPAGIAQAAREVLGHA